MNLVAHWYRQYDEHWIKIYDLDVCQPEQDLPGPAWVDWGAMLTLHGWGDLALEPDSIYHSKWDAEHVFLRRTIISAIEEWDAHGNRRRLCASAAAAALDQMGIPFTKMEANQLENN